MQGVDLRRADLSHASFKGSNLEAANVSDEQLQQAKSLEDAIMPDGKKYEPPGKNRR